uniref:Uncharacterized protein LOC111101975 n=1 Tax=Crassostrea virginica TaxID=6565 RepID=A0A8B8AIG5_CRAVI|nr:uncharacterized protein LOC111101975 [Crassostrea virginica]
MFSAIAWSQVQDVRGGGLGVGLATPPRKKNDATETMTRDIPTHGTWRDADQETGSMTFSDQSRKGFTTQKVDLLSPKQNILLACWNVRTLFQTGITLQLTDHSLPESLDLCLCVSKVQYFHSPRYGLHKNQHPENNNGDVLVSDFGHKAVVVTSGEGVHRFSYTGPPSGSRLEPREICTDVMSHILVSDFMYHCTVQMLDRDGQFLSYVFTRQTPGMNYRPWGLSYDVNTHAVWVGSIEDKTMSVCRHIDRHLHLADEGETHSIFDEGETHSDFDEGETHSDFDEGETNRDFDEGETHSDFDEEETHSDFDEGETHSDFDEGETHSDFDEEETQAGMR